ncbi:MAG: bifunctional diaminohydroxyphosphoribosylaminopyrimidine deaminase/5-amino-6-(5-phosphoribosylamino)uracil reductase RibD [Bacteroidia bacterium]|nr:bifunctional diaminohydroxyphosphoribosylaminopyrimidine deaminase/5-amino-6-(5-phosphoribosylamino)uracil reductase RibD [Bacteroidia bacterium]
MEDEKYMRRCIQLALNGQKRVAPNPMVGAVVVYQDRIIGEGYHQCFGEAHAEVNAIGSVKDQTLLEKATIYVSLEPCSHYGKTPPCVDLILEKRIPRIVIGCQDPFPEVAGRGIRKLIEAGREVVVGVLEKECQYLIREFITFNTLKRPYISLKWAESQDRFIDVNRTDGKPVILSNSQTSMLTHKRRAEATAIMVGTRTALLDNPTLNVRHWAGQNPIRVVIDHSLTLPQSLHLFDGSIPTLVFTTREHPNRQNVTYYKINKEEGLKQIMTQLYELKIQSLLVEGGSVLHQSFLDADLWDEAFVEICPIKLHDGVKAPSINASINPSVSEHFGRQIKHYKNIKKIIFA